MKALNVYLSFAGNCEEALKFYEQALGGKTVFLQRFGDTEHATPENSQRIMHAQFEADGIRFMASDSMDDQPIKAGDAISLSINLDDAAEQTRIFNALAAGGKVTMPLQDTFWNAHFGMVTDKYGFHWLLNRELSHN